MPRSHWVTFFVYCCLSLSTVQAVAAERYYYRPKVEASPWSFNFKGGGEHSLTDTSSINASIGSSLEYKFYRDAVLGTEFSWYSPFTDFDNYVYNGSSDLSVYLGGIKLYKNRRMGFDVTGRLSATAPTSPGSREASLLWAAGQGLVVKKIFTDRTNVTYTLAATEYSVKYIEAEVDDDGTTWYNTKYDIANRVYLNQQVVKDVNFLIGGGAKYYYNYMDRAHTIWKISTGFSIDLSKWSSLDFSMATYLKNSEADKTWNGPATSDHFFDAAGTVYNLSLSFKI